MKKYTIPVVALLCLYIVATADKIEKKGTILNSKCNPIGTKCSSTLSGKEATTTYIYNEPKAGSFSVQYSEEGVNTNPHLRAALVGKRSILLEEDMPIPSDVIRALTMPKGYTVPQGEYPIVYARGVYTIIFIP